jgi:TPR repeat protein
MLRKLLLTMIIALSLTMAQTKAQESEDSKARPNKQETLDSMIKAGRIPAQQQKARIDSLWAGSTSSDLSKTPRSDFLFCLGLSFLGNCKAQRCVGNRYERGIGIVEDLSEAYAWYSVALENQTADEASKGILEADKERVKTRLLSAYPHPTEDDLDDMTRALQTRIGQYQEDAKKAKK